MDDLDNCEYPRGSEWRRWDPHLHAPGTLLSDQFGGDWEKYLQRVESATPKVEALGVTDYFCIETYREVRRRKTSGRLPEVKLLFPNVEMRLDLKTEKKKAVNIHLLFSPEDPHHEEEIERVLSELTFEFRERKYHCTLPDLAALGRAFDKKQTDELGARRCGANQFKTTLTDLRELFRQDMWLRTNCLVAVAGGLGDGTSGLQTDDAFTAIRHETEAFAHIIFAGTPSQREFWLGRKPNFDRAFIEHTYRSLKPCLHGSDAHRGEKVLAPDEDRFCWLKGDPMFETLRQAVIEPEERVWIGSSPPTGASVSICGVRTTGTPWLHDKLTRLNAGLVTIIGARGSGKTALVDIIAAGANAMKPDPGESSFLRRASSPIDFLQDAEVALCWTDGSSDKAAISLDQAPIGGEQTEKACYLSQHFVEHLCSSAGLATELRTEMERVVFEATDLTERLEANSFEELANITLEPIRRRRVEIRTAIETATESIVREDLLRNRLPKMRKDREALARRIQEARKQLVALLPKDKEKRARELERLEKLCAESEAKVEALVLRKKTLDDLTLEVKHLITRTEPSRFVDMRQRFAAAGLDASEWDAFGMKFKGDVDGILDRANRSVEALIAAATKRSDPNSRLNKVTAIPSSELSLNDLKEALDAVKKEVGIDSRQQRKYEELQRWVKEKETSLRRLDSHIKNAEGAVARRRELVQSRRAAYEQIFHTLVQEEEVLAKLYAPLRRELVAAEGALSKLSFIIRRQVDLDAWVKTGEELLDLRKETKFRGHGALRKETSGTLLQAWRQGTVEDVVAAMEKFREGLQAELTNAMPNSLSAEERETWLQRIAAWLYDTNHIAINYGIQYDGVPIEQLSPGTRGIVLLLLYLAVDQRDRRPLIIDQPEENLDPNSVYQELVPHFREARKRRQVIVVTHNANLVVNTDSDQVIVAQSAQTKTGGLPTISYQSGSLENPLIRTLVCDTLEGGERAFLERERRYRLRWEATITQGS